MTITNASSGAPRPHIFGAMRSDVGRVRSANEDTVAFVAPAEGSPEGRRGYLALVADGMGGHAAGEVASGLAAEVIRRVFYAAETAPHEALKSAFVAANQLIFERGAASPDLNGMGTTCTAIVIRDNSLWLAHIGDTRAYLMRDGVLAQLSDDQTLHAQLVRDGVMTAAEAASSPGGNIILQALGARQAIAPTIWTEGQPLYSGDIVVLCSDGLYDLVDDAELARIVCRQDPQDACAELIERALKEGGYDNISIGVFRIVEAQGGRTGSQAATRSITVVAADEDAGGALGQTAISIKV